MENMPDTDIHQRYQTLHHLDPGMGLSLGVLGFPVIKIMVVRQVRKLSACTAVWAWRQSSVKSRVARKDHKRIYFAFALACVVGKNLKSPPKKLSPMADHAITRGGIGSLVSLVYICDAKWYMKCALYMWLPNRCNVPCWKPFSNSDPQKFQNVFKFNVHA